MLTVSLKPSLVPRYSIPLAKHYQESAQSKSSDFRLHQHIAQLQASLDDANQELYEMKRELADREARLQVMESMIMRKTFSTYHNPDICMLDFEDKPTSLDVKKGMTQREEPKKDQRA